MTLKEFSKLKVGDKVIVTKPIKDAYQETWHEKGETVTIKSFTPDGVGAMFEWSDLGTHYKNIEYKPKTGITNAIIRGIKKLNY